jgi:hypothetical protein
MSVPMAKSPKGCAPDKSIYSQFKKMAEVGLRISMYSNAPVSLGASCLRKTMISFLKLLAVSGLGCLSLESSTPIQEQALPNAWKI